MKPKTEYYLQPTTDVHYLQSGTPDNTCTLLNTTQQFDSQIRRAL